MRGRMRHHGMPPYHYGPPMAPPPPPPPVSGNTHRLHNYHHQSGSVHNSQTRPPFDVYMVEDFFPKVAPANEVDNQLSSAILARNTDLTPTPEENTNIINLVSKVQIVLENITLSPGGFDACQIDEVRPVGSFKKGTMSTGKNIADMVVILKTLPVKDAIQTLAHKVLDELIKIDSNSVLTIEPNAGGFDLVNGTSSATVRVLIATIMPNLRKLDTAVHLPLKLIQRHLSAIRHARWFEESANLTSVKVLIRVLRDVCSRFEGLRHLTPWMVDVLSHYSLTFRNQQSHLSLNLAFKRVLQLLAGGIFLPGSSGIPDPCENGAISMHAQLSLMQQDAVCMTAQTLLRILSYGDGYRVILGLQNDVIGITNNMSVWDGVVVAPSTAAFELPPKDEAMEQDEDEKESAENDSNKSTASV